MNPRLTDSQLAIEMLATAAEPAWAAGERGAWPSPADGAAATSAAAEGECTASRRPPEAGDRMLLERTFKWLATLPAAVRPMAAGRQFPRIVNRLSELWGHCEYTRLYLQSLLVDRRKGREGFPAHVRDELVALQQYYFRHLSGLPPILWNAVPVRAPRIPGRAFPLPVDAAEIEITPL